MTGRELLERLLEMPEHWLDLPVMLGVSDPERETEAQAERVSRDAMGDYLWIED